MFHELLRGRALGEPWRHGAQHVLRNQLGGREPRGHSEGILMDYQPGISWVSTGAQLAHHRFTLRRNRSIVQCPGKSVAPTNSSVWEALRQSQLSVMSRQFKKIWPMVHGHLGVWYLLNQPVLRNQAVILKNYHDFRLCIRVGDWRLSPPS